MLFEFISAINPADAWIACTAIVCGTVLTIYFSSKDDK